MAQVLGTALSVQIDIGTLVVKVAIAAIKLVRSIGRASLLESVEDVEAMILVKFECLAIFFRT